ncbi:MAG: hypothetical protein KAQ98_08615 [Bacteriovoracaceae bacterium]|nr:hypothetical protein [Bacteriovoracaceae bacterium]
MKITIAVLTILMSLNLMAKNTFTYENKEFFISSGKVTLKLQDKNSYVQDLKVKTIRSDKFLGVAKFFGSVILPERFDTDEFFVLKVEGKEFGKKFKANCQLTVEPMDDSALLKNCKGKNEDGDNFYLKDVLFHTLDELGNFSS